MILIHIALYIVMLTIGCICGLLYPQIPWVGLWAFSSFAVITWRLAKLNQQRQFKQIMQAHQLRMEQYILQDSLEDSINLNNEILNTLGE
jgi:hypothetical protein